MRKIDACLGRQLAGYNFARWQTWQAEFTAASSGVCVGPDPGEDCDVSRVIDRSNVYGDVKEVMCVPDTHVTVINGLGTQSNVTITSVDFGLPEEFRANFRLDDVEPWSIKRGPDQALYYPGQARGHSRSDRRTTRSYCASASR